MDRKVNGSTLGGEVRAIPSKSQAHRMLICSALAEGESSIYCPAINEDIEATADCLNTLGAKLTRSEGSYTVQLGNQKPQSTGCGGFFIAPSGTQQTITHSVDPKSQKMSGRWIFIDAVINKAYRPDFLYDFPTVVPDEQAKKLNALFDSLFSADTIFDRYSCYYQILKVLLEELATPKNTRIHSSMQSALEHIQKNFAEEIRIEDLAKCAHMSPSNLFAVFKKEFGISPITYVNQYRLSMAAEYLLQKDASVSEIATMTGFHDALYFSKMFHKMYQVSPREYRKQNKV